MTIKRPKPRLTYLEMLAKWHERQDDFTVPGQHVATFVIPLDMCKRQDARLKNLGWKAAKDKRELTGYLRSQMRPRAECLTGRPYVLCVRFSSVEPDKYSDWAKLAVDCICAPNKRSPSRLNIIRDDAPKFAEIDQRWVEAKPGEGFCVVEIWTGEP